MADVVKALALVVKIAAVGFESWEATKVDVEMAPPGRWPNSPNRT